MDMRGGVVRAVIPCLARQTAHSLSVLNDVIPWFLIAEITLDDTSQFGLEWKYAAQNRIGGASVRQDPSVDFANLNDPAKQAKLQGLKYSVIDGEKFSSFLQMLNSKSRINVLSSPQLLTTNNSKAYFEETIKVPTLQTTTTSTGVTSSSIEYQEIGIKLNVTPQVNRDEFINLNINQTMRH
jgi:general secretion pathway protein D